MRVVTRVIQGRARKAGFAAAVAAALAVAGVAVAGGASTTTAVSATFVATTVADRNVQTCTGTDGTYEVTNATYTGTSTSSDPNLNGPIRVTVRSVLNTTKNLGWLRAGVQIDSTTPGDGARAILVAVNSAGALQGMLLGDESTPHAKLLANLTASFNGATGFASAAVGTGGGTDTAVTFGGSCDHVAPPHPPKAIHVHVPKLDDNGHGHHGDNDDQGEHHGKRHH